MKDISNKNLQLQKELKEVQDETRKEGGPFKEKFDDFMDTLKLKRQIYHIGAMAGNDIDKIFSKTTMITLSDFDRYSNH